MAKKTEKKPEKGAVLVLEADLPEFDSSNYIPEEEFIAELEENPAKKKNGKKKAGALINPDLPSADATSLEDLENLNKPPIEYKTTQEIDHAIVVEEGRHYTEYFHVGARLTDKNLIRELTGDPSKPHVPGCIRLEVHYRDIFVPVDLA